MHIINGYTLLLYLIRKRHEYWLRSLPLWASRNSTIAVLYVVVGIKKVQKIMNGQ